MGNDVQMREERGRRWRRARILNAWVDSLAVNDVVDLLDDGGMLFTINPEHLYQLQRSQDFARAYANASYVSCDSTYVYWALKLLGRGLEHRASGSDIVPAYWRHHADNPEVTIFLLGAKPGIAERARQRINLLAGREIVVGTHAPSFSVCGDQVEIEDAIDRINASGATCLIVGMGAPKQEIWLDHLRSRLPAVKVLMGVGATIDYEAEAVKRAPNWMRHNGLEWIYRVLTEPRRYVRRYARNTEFLWLALLDRFGLYRPPGLSKAVTHAP